MIDAKDLAEIRVRYWEAIVEGFRVSREGFQDPAIIRARFEVIRRGIVTALEDHLIARGVDEGAAGGLAEDICAAPHRAKLN